MGNRPTITSGVCHVTYAFDVGLSVRLKETEALLRGAATRLAIVDRRRPASVFQLEADALIVRRAIDEVEVAGFKAVSEATLTIYDFAGLTVTFRMPLRGSLEDLVSLSAALYENKALNALARSIAQDVLTLISPAVSRPQLAPVAEDYCVFQVDGWEEPIDVSRLLEAHGDVIARILRAEDGPLSPGEQRDAIESRLGYRPDELVVIDWNAALVIDRDAESVVSVLTFANLELLELRLLDARLDQLLDEAYEAVLKPGWRFAFGLSVPPQQIRRIARLQVDAAILFEQVNNAIKLFGDQFLARIYRAASSRFHIDEWDASILRKLSTVEGIYEKVSDDQGTRRMEFLEWIIILLIAFEVVMSFVRAH